MARGQVAVSIRGFFCFEPTAEELLGAQRCVVDDSWHYFDGSCVIFRLWSEEAG